MKLCGLVPNSYIHVSVSDLYISRISLPIWLQQTTVGRQILGIYKLLTDTWMQKLGDRPFLFCFGNKESTQFYFWEYINRNQTFILDFHQSFICSVAASASEVATRGRGAWKSHLLQKRWLYVESKSLRLVLFCTEYSTKSFFSLDLESFFERNTHFFSSSRLLMVGSLSYV